MLQHFLSDVPVHLLLRCIIDVIWLQEEENGEGGQEGGKEQEGKGEKKKNKIKGGKKVDLSLVSHVLVLLGCNSFDFCAVTPDSSQSISASDSFMY